MKASGPGEEQIFVSIMSMIIAFIRMISSHGCVLLVFRYFYRVSRLTKKGPLQLDLADDEEDLSWGDDDDDDDVEEEEKKPRVDEDKLEEQHAHHPLPGHDKQEQAPAEEEEEEEEGDDPTNLTVAIEPLTNTSTTAVRGSPAGFETPVRSSEYALIAFIIIIIPMAHRPHYRSDKTPLPPL